MIRTQIIGRSNLLARRSSYKLSSPAGLALLGTNGNVRLQEALLPPPQRRRPSNHDHDNSNNNNRSFCCSPAQQSLLVRCCSPIRTAAPIRHADNYSTNSDLLARPTRRLFSTTGDPSSLGGSISNRGGNSSSGGGGTSGREQCFLDDDSRSSDTAASTSVDEIFDKALAEQQQRSEQIISQQHEGGGAVGEDAWYVVGEQAANWTPQWWNLSDDSVLFVKYLHDVAGIEYGWSIVCATVVMRVAVFPLMVYAQRSSSRMAYMQPQINAMKERFQKLDKPTTEDQAQFRKAAKDLFAKYEVKPFVPILSMCVQMPLFLGFFFGMRKMPELYPDDLAVGGIFWFPDLTVSDPLYILPVTSAVTFLALIELGKGQMTTTASSSAYGDIMTNYLRFMALIIIPVSSYFPSTILCYWTTSNAVTLVQTVLLRQKSVRDYFGIWEMPKPVPGGQNNKKTGLF